MAKRHDLLVRFLLIGDSGVGKTCMICRFADDKFEEEWMSTVGEFSRPLRLCVMRVSVLGV